MAQSQQDPRFFVQQITETARKLESSSPDEQRQWAREIRAYADAISGSQTQKTALSVEALVTSPQSIADIAQEIDRGNLPGVREVTYRRDNDGTNKLRVSASQEAMPQVSKVLQTMGRHFEESYSSSSQSRSQSSR